MSSNDTTPSRRRSASAFLNAALLACIASILALDFNGYRWLMPVDEGQWLFYAGQILKGRVLYTEIWYQFGPAVVYGLAGSMLVAGKTLATERIFFWMLNIAGLASLYVFTTSLNKRASPRLVLCLVALLNSLTCRLSMTNPGFLFRQCFNLLPLYLLFNMESPLGVRRRFAFTAGVLSMLGILVSQETGLCSLVASAVFLILRAKHAGQAGDRFEPLWLFASGFLSGLTLWCAFCLSQGNLLEYFQVGFIEVFLMAGKHQSAALPGLATLSGSKANINDYYHFGLTYLPVLAAAATALWLVCKRSWNARLLALCSYGIGTFGVLLGRCDLYHSTYAALPLLLLLGYGFEKASSVPRAFGRYAYLALTAVFCALIVLANSNNLAKLASQSRFAATVAYDEPLAHLGSALIPKWQHAALRFSKRTIEENTDVDQEFLAILHGPHQYFFIDRPTETRFATPIFANSEKAKHEILEDIKRDRYEFVVYERVRFRDIDYDFYFSDILEYLNDHYELHSEIPRQVRILRLRHGERGRQGARAASTSE